MLSKKVWVELFQGMVTSTKAGTDLQAPRLLVPRGQFEWNHSRRAGLNAMAI